MEPFTKGNKYLDLIALRRTNFERLINRIKSSHMTIHGAVGRWSVKECIVYIQLCELYLADRINHIFSDHNLNRRFSDVQMLGLLFEHDPPEFGTRFELDTISMNWKIQKYNSIPLEDVVGLENMAYLAFISLLQINEDRWMARNHFHIEILDSILNVYDYFSTAIEKWLGFVQ